VTKIARSTGFVKRIGELHPCEFLYSLLISAVNGHGETLSGLLDIAQSTVSRTALHKRFNEASVEFMQAVLGKVLQQLWRPSRCAEGKGILKKFKRVVIHDSSGWNLRDGLGELFPGSGGKGSSAGCKLQLGFDILSGLFQDITLTSGKKSDQGHSKYLVDNAKARDLWLFDLGYFALRTLEKFEELGAYFLCKLFPGVGLFEERNGKLVSIDIIKVLRKVDKQGLDCFETRVLLGTNNLCVRLIAEKLPEEEKRRRIQKLKKGRARSGRTNKGRTLSTRSRVMAGWNLYITNASAGMLPARSVGSLYRVRWSIELVFKQLKSLLKLHKSNHENQYRLACEIYAKLIVAALTLVSHARLQNALDPKLKKELSIEKMFKTLQRRSQAFKDFLYRGVTSATKFLLEFYQTVIARCTKERSPKKPTTLQRLDFATKKRRKFENLGLRAYA